MRTIALVLCLLAAAARADVPSPDVEACTGKQVGEACGDASHCAAARCSRATPPGVPPAEWDCVRCVPGAVDGGGSNHHLPIALGGAAVVLAAGIGLAYRRKRRSS